MEKRKSNIFTRTLIFISVFIVLCSVCVIPVFAQAPNIDLNVLPSTTRNTIQFYCYEDDNLCLIAYGQNDTSQVVQSGTVVFTDYYYNNHYTSNLDNDLLNFDDIIFDNIYITRLNATQTFVSTTVSNSNLYDVALARGFDDFTFSRMFINSYNNQFLYWENQLVPVQDAFDRGYTQALNDSDAFGRGLAQIFSAPFVFVQNIVGFEIFNISIFEIFSFFLVCALAIFLFRKIRGFLPI